MSITGDPQTAAAGSSSVPAEGVTPQPGTGVPSSNADAAVSPAEVGDGAGTPDLAGLSELDLQNPEVVKFLRERNYFTRDDLAQATRRMQTQQAQSQQRAQQVEERAQALDSQRQFLERHLRENMGDEEVENLLGRYDREHAQEREAIQQERTQLAQTWVQQEQQKIENRIVRAIRTADGQELFNVNDPEIDAAKNNYLAAVRALGLAQTEQAQDVMNQWGEYVFDLINHKREAGLRRVLQNTQTQDSPSQPEQSTQQPPSRGRQVTSPGGAGGGVPNFSDLYKQNTESGMNPEEAFEKAQLAVMTAGSAS